MTRNAQIQIQPLARDIIYISQSASLAAAGASIIRPIFVRRPPGPLFNSKMTEKLPDRKINTYKCNNFTLA